MAVREAVITIDEYDLYRLKCFAALPSHITAMVEERCRLGEENAEPLHSILPLLAALVKQIEGPRPVDFDKMWEEGRRCYERGKGL